MTTDVKVCASCREPFTRPSNVGPAAWETRKYCSTACRHEHPGRRDASPPTVTAATADPGPLGNGWREHAACLAADPERFAPVDLHTNDEMARFEQAAHAWCTRCPVMAECGQFADQHRHTGLYGGVHRRVRAGRYVWSVLADGAAEPQLTDRRSGVRVGWVA